MANVPIIPEFDTDELPFDPSDPDGLPGEIQLDETHPANQKFMQDLANFRRTLTAQATQMQPRHLQAAKMKLQGKKNTEIAAAIGMKAASIPQLWHRADIQNYMTIFAHFTAALQGPQESMRKNMLFRIALNNELLDPKASISALQEINKMEGTYATAASNTTNINIDIPSDLFPKGVLDQ